MIKVRELLEQLDIAAVIGSEIALTRRGKEYIGLCPFHDDHSPSFSVNPVKKFAHCFACKWSGNALDFIMEKRGLAFKPAARALISEWKAGQFEASGMEYRPAPRKVKTDEVRWVSSVPPGNFAPPTMVTAMGKPSKVWEYKDEKGRRLGYVARYDDAGRKVVLCWSWGAEIGQQATHAPAGGWKARHFSKPRPLFGLDLLAERPGAQVMVVEGEKSAEAARLMFPKQVVITWPGGCPGIKAADWRPLRGREVILVPDADQPGVDAMAWIGAQITEGPAEWRVQTAKVILPDPEAPAGWDLGDVAWSPEEAISWATKRGPIEVRKWDAVKVIEPVELRDGIAFSVRPPEPTRMRPEPEPVISETMTAEDIERVNLWEGYDDLLTAPAFAHDAGAVIDWKALEKSKPPERDWAITGWLGMGHTTLLAGSGGIGKSLIAQTIAAAIAVGRDYVGAIPKPRRVMLWATEDDHDEIWRRQVCIARHFNLPLSAFSNLVVVPRSGMNNSFLEITSEGMTWQAPYDELCAMVRDHEIEVLFVDNVAQSCPDEINRAVVTRFCNAFNGIRKGLSTVLVTHIGRALGSEFSGSSAWENACRMRWYLGAKLPDEEGEQVSSPDDNTDARFLCKRKANYSTKDFVKLEYRDGIFAPDFVPERTFLSMDHAKVSKAIVIKAFKWLVANGYIPTDSNNSPNYLPKLALRHKLGQNLTLRQMGSVVDEVIQAGTFKRAAVATYDSGNKRMGLILAEDI